MSKYVRKGPAPTAWSDERTETLRTLVMEGHSATEIGRRLGGMSRNAVISKANRMGLTLGMGEAATPLSIAANRRAAGLPPVPTAKRAKPTGGATCVITTAEANAKARRSEAVRAADLAGQPRPAFSPPGAVPEALATAPRHWITRRPGECRWPIGDGADLMSCCNPITKGSYCEAHARIAYTASKAYVTRDDDKRRFNHYGAGQAISRVPDSEAA